MKTPYCEIYDYCREHIENFDLKERIALDNMDKWRCPLSMAFPQLYNEMQSCICDWCYDNEFSFEFNESDIDVEDVFWEGCSAPLNS